MLGVGPASGGAGGTEVSARGGGENMFVEQGWWQADCFSVGCSSLL